MKMITAIINNKDAGIVCDVLRENGIGFTKIATTGGFLRIGNTTVLIGVEDDKFEQVLELIRTHSARRTEYLSNSYATRGDTGSIYPIEVQVGGALVFVTNVDYFERM